VEGLDDSQKSGEVVPKAPAVRVRSRRFLSRRAFVAVLSGLTAFVVLQVSLSVVIEIGMPEVRDPLYGRRLRLVQKALRAKPGRSRTVIMLGTSRTLYGFRPGATETTWGGPNDQPVSAFNFGVSGASPLTQLLMWRRLQQDGVRPDLLLIEVMPPLLCSQTDPHDFHPTHWPAARLRWGDLALVKRYAGARRSDLRRDWLGAFVLPCYVQRCKLTSLIAPKLLPKMYRQNEEWNVDEFGGLEPLAALTAEEQRRRTQEARQFYGTFLNGFHLGGPACEALRELMASCHKEGVPMALVLMPEGPAFRSWYSAEVLGDVQGLVRQLSLENAAPVIDAREWIAENDFLESNHLLSGGAEKFTERLGREYILPLLHRLSNEGKSPHGLAVLPSQS
jgi:hypothetical protein